jgi:hypothetical protein
MMCIHMLHDEVKRIEREGLRAEPTAYKPNQESALEKKMKTIGGEPVQFLGRRINYAQVIGH